MTPLVRSFSALFFAFTLALFGCGAEPEAATTGTLRLQSTPAGAQVLLDGVAVGLVTDCQVTGLPPGVYQVRLRLDGYADATGEVEAVAGAVRIFQATLASLTQPPPMPTGVTVTPGEGYLTLAWDAVPHATSYTVYWTASGAEPTRASAGITVAQPGYLHGGLDPWVEYRYRVSASNVLGESELSPVVSGTPLPVKLAPPYGLEAIVTGSQVTLQWRPVQLGGVTWSVWRGTSPAHGGVIANGLCVPRFSEPLPQEGVTAYYRVQAQMRGGFQSPWSEPVTAWRRAVIAETERNGPDGYTTNSWYVTGDSSALGLDHFTLKGRFDEAWAIPVPGAGQLMDFDVFQVSIAPGTLITVDVTDGVVNDPAWPMRVNYVCVSRTADGELRDEVHHSFVGAGGMWTAPWRCALSYLVVVMPESLAAHGDYGYRVDVSLTLRKF